MRLLNRFIEKIKAVFIRVQNGLKRRWQSMRRQQYSVETTESLIPPHTPSSESFSPVRNFLLTTDNDTNTLVLSTPVSTAPEKKGTPFAAGFFGQLPRELFSNIFSELSVQAPILEIIENEATLEQKARVVAGKSYHVISTLDSNGNWIYPHLGFAKKSTDGSISYATEPLDQTNVFYMLITQEPHRLSGMTNAEVSRDTYAFYFLEEAIQAEKGVVSFHLQNRIHLAGVCRNFRKMMNPSQALYAERFQKTIQEEQLEIVLRHVLFGNQTAAEKQLKANPSLLLPKNTHPMTDFSGKSVQGLTSFQAALCVGDVDMCEMMRKIFLTMENGEQLMQAQFCEIFPEGVETKIEKQNRNAFKFDEIINVIIHSLPEHVTAALSKEDDGSPLCEALKQFRKVFKEKSDLERVFNPYHLLAAFERYDQQFDDFQSRDQQQLFCIHVIGFVQRSLPACHVQAFAQSLYEIVDEKRSLQRSFKFKYGKDTTIPAVHVPTSSGVGLGFDYLAGCCGKRGGLGGTVAGVAWRLRYKKFVKQKYRVLHTYANQTIGPIGRLGS